ncbi:biotin/lipoyl-containing protein [Inediibacterium massiliense]|uniref:biotin/lipoyl-containing protein n=1 Tax=Inediibacterium massiliense TaxID=1658111 RepID=UPI0006B56399|nr:biotin/lipoyl-containing protein [Inediibacterium massiliense]
MKKFNITVNGNSYEVEVEELGGVTSTPAQRPVVQRSQAPVPKAAPKPQPQKAAKAPVGGNTVTAPMPGTILDIKVKEGDTVDNGQVLLILEAMKMENEIMAPLAGKVVSIHTTKGASVNAGDVLVVLG